MFKGKSPLSAAAFQGVLLVLSAQGCGSDQTASDKAAALANVDAMPAEQAADTSRPGAAAQVAPARPVISETLAYTELDDELVYGYFSVPADMFEPLPAVIVIHEWWGLENNVRAMADRLAGEGYIVFAVDLFAGQVASSPFAARGLMISVVEDPDSASDNIRAAYDFVRNKAGAPSVAALGFGFGGGWSLNTAQLFPEELDAAVIYYGQATADEDKLRPIEAPILGLFAAEDRGIKVESVEAFADALERLRKDHDIHIYPGVKSAFANPTGDNYNADAAEDAWRRTLQFLDEHLVTDAT